MPWKETYVMDERARFVLEGMEENTNLAALCRRFGISRKTGYKWLLRYRTQGLAGLYDVSRRPLTIPHETSAATICEIIRFRLGHTSWGPKKIKATLAKRGVKGLPATSTIGAILDRSGLIVKKRRTRRRPYPQSNHCVSPNAPNDVWTVDYKGWWFMQDGRRCVPLTIRDEYSKYILRIAALGECSRQAAQEQFERVFHQYGLPKVIRSDNGTPFAGNGITGLSGLSAWWIRLGIRPDRTRPAHPQDNGGHERMHRDLKKELQKEPCRSLDTEQERFDRWSSIYNHERPHEALGQRTPDEVYNQSDRRYQGTEKAPDYPTSWLTKLVYGNGCIRWKDDFVYISSALCGDRVGMEEVEKDNFRVWYGMLAIGELEFTAAAALRPTAFATQPQ